MLDFDIVKEVALFRGLNAEQIKTLSEIASVRNFKKNEYLISETEKCENLFIIAKGYARVATHTKEGEEPFSLLQRGDFLGEVSLIDGRLPSASVIAQQDLKVIAIAHSDLKELMKRDNSIATAILWELAQILCLKVRKTTLSLSVARQKASDRLFI